MYFKKKGNISMQSGSILLFVLLISRMLLNNIFDHIKITSPVDSGSCDRLINQQKHYFIKWHSL